MTDWWSFILKQEGRDELGALLAKHPEAIVRSERLMTNLTVMKLIKIANSEYNYCRLNRDIPKGPDVVARSNVAWQILDHKTRTIAMRPGTAWMRTVALLAEGSDEGLARTRELSIERLIVVCERLIKGPYTKLTKSGGAMRW
jgi:hypothetical protein